METEAIKLYETQGTELLAHAESIKIVDNVTRETAAEFTTRVRATIKSIKQEFRPDIDNAHQLHRDLLARLKKLIAPFEGAQRIIDREISRDYMEQERVRREEERVAREKAEAERVRQEEQLVKEAEELINTGELEEAKVILGSEVVVNPDKPVPPVQKTVKTAAGSTTMKKDIKVELMDKLSVINAVAQTKLPHTLLTVDLGAAKRYAKSGGLRHMIGFRITNTAIVSGRVG